MSHTQTEYLGADSKITYGSEVLVGVLNVTLSEVGGPAAEGIDVTVNDDSSYTTIVDPFGAKGNPKSTVTVTMHDSTASVADVSNHAFAFNTAAALKIETAENTATANQWDHAAMELVSRTTEIPFNEPATCTLVFEGNGAGTWTGPA